MAVLLWGLVAALVLSAPVAAAVVPIMGLGEDDEEQEATPSGEPPATGKEAQNYKEEAAEDLEKQRN